MNFNLYISVSILSHLLLISLLSVTQFNTATSSPIFDVKIVGPAEKIMEPEKKTGEYAKNKYSKPVPRRRKPKLLMRRRKLPEKTLPPETLWGKKGGETKNAKKGRESSDISEKEIKGSADKESMASINKEKSNREGTMLAPSSSLFDKNTIEKYARKNAPPVNKGLTFDVPEFRHRGYMRMLKERIEDIWKYPEEAARRRISGDLFIKFTIKKDGKLGEVNLVRTSGYRDLDKAAIKAVKSAGPFWPLPIDYDKDSLDITGHFIYIYGNAILM